MGNSGTGLVTRTTQINFEYLKLLPEITMGNSGSVSSVLDSGILPRARIQYQINFVLEMSNNTKSIVWMYLELTLLLPIAPINGSSHTSGAREETC